MFEGFALAGETAALGTALSWAVSSLIFAAAARRIDAPHLNFLRIHVAVVFLFLAVAVTGTGWSLPASQCGLLAVSGVVGLVAGDGAYFRSLRILGPRRAMLLMSLAPVATASVLAAVPSVRQSRNPPALLARK